MWVNILLCVVLLLKVIFFESCRVLVARKIEGRPRILNPFHFISYDIERLSLGHAPSVQKCSQYVQLLWWLRRNLFGVFVSLVL